MNLNQEQAVRVPTGVWHVYSRHNGVIVIDGEIRARTRSAAIALAADVWDVASFHLAAHDILCCTGRC